MSQFTTEMRHTVSDSITELLTPKATNLVFAALLDTCLIHFEKLPLPVAREVNKTLEYVVKMVDDEGLPPPSMDEYGDKL